MDQYLLTTKLYPSSANPEFVPRQRLIEQLKDSAQQRLRVIHASAGYGKTSLLTQWYHLLHDAGGATAWLTIDADDNRPSTFVAYLLKALEQAGLSLPSTQAMVGNSLRNTSLKSVAIVLINEIAQEDRSIHLLLDDYEHIENADIHELLDFLIARSPEQLKFTIASRTAPPLTLADMVARQDLVTLTAEDLKMDMGEAAALFAGDAAHLSLDDISMLVERTEGWVIALRLANLWIASQQDSTAHIASFSGQVAELADYMTEQIFNSRSEDDQTFLLLTALPRRINGDLANALCDRSDAWEVLERIQKQDLLIGAVDPERRWYRYHNLFREFLVSMLNRRRGEDVVNLHARAADWHLENGELAEAIRHAHAAGNTRAVAEELERRGGWLLYLRGHVDLMGLAADLIAPDDVDRHIRLSLFRVHMQLKQQSPSLARETYEAMREKTKGFKVWRDKPISELQQAELLLMDSLIAGYQDKPFSTDDLDRVEQLCASLPVEEALLRATAFNVACLLYLQAGQLDRCQAAGNQAIACFRQVNAVYMESFIYFHQGKALLMQGKLRDTEMVYAENDHLVKKYFGPDSDFALIEAVYRAELLYLKNELNEARDCITEPLARVGHFDSWFDVHHTTFSVAAGCERASNGLEAAQQMLQRAAEFARRNDIPRLAAMIQVQQIRNLLWAGDVDAAQALAGRHRIEEVCAAYDRSNISTRRIYFAHCLLKVRLAIYEGRYDPALSQLDQLDADLAAMHADYASLEPLLLRAVCWFRSGRVREAYALIDQAVSQALFDGHQRPFIEEGELIAPLLKGYVEETQSDGSNRLRDRFLREVMQSLENESRVRERSDALLTARQMQVLKNVQRGYSNKEIARRIDVGENTVKFHLKNIYRILDASTRQDAISEAIRRNLL
ncbi:MAG: LuxR C-terminal-related transcriptional regulator [Pseudomonadota bacterium]